MKSYLFFVYIYLANIDLPQQLTSIAQGPLHNRDVTWSVGWVVLSLSANSSSSSIEKRNYYTIFHFSFLLLVVV
jgi:hypothetical protein